MDHKQSSSESQQNFIVAEGVTKKAHFSSNLVEKLPPW